MAIVFGLNGMRIRRPLAITAIILSILVFCGALFSGYVYWLAKQAEPMYNGSLTFTQLNAPVKVVFGPHAIPQIQAQSLPDLMFAQGYVVASERMWQMDLMRRLARGKLSEVLGEKTVPVDRFFRLWGLTVAAQKHYASLSDHGRDLLQSFSSGVNAYQSKHIDELPLEYRIAGFDPAPWDPVDSLAIAEYMNFLLSFNAKQELAFLKIAQHIGIERALELFPTDVGMPAPPYSVDLPTLTNQTSNPLRQYQKFAANHGLPLAGPASNAWAISGTKTQSGLPILANDPHLSPSAPGVWYELELQAPGFHVAGVSLPGIPLIIIGHNPHIAWGFTTSMADTQDIFLERLTDKGQSVKRPHQATEKIALRREIIHVKGKAEAISFNVRSTRNGVILNDVMDEWRPGPYDLTPMDSPYLFARRSNLEVPDQALDGLYKLNTAQDVNQARSAIGYFKHLSQNMHVVDTAGNNFWQVSGALPKRGSGSGTFPMLGWESGSEWKGFKSVSDNPHLKNPARGYLITANNRTDPGNDAEPISHSWLPPFRARRIEQLVQSKPVQALTDIEKMQLDQQSLEARQWLSALKRVERELKASDQQAWQIATDQLLHWDGTFTHQSTSATFFIALRNNMMKALFADELQQEYETYLSVAGLSYSALHESVSTGRSTFWDNITTQQVETPVNIWAQVLKRTEQDLSGSIGAKKLRVLGRVRPLVFPHAFHSAPILNALFDIGPVNIGGDNQTINVAKASLTNPNSPSFVPSYRFIFTPGQWEQTRGTNTLGQSGHRFSPYRTDQLSDWINGRTHPWYWGGPPDETSIGTLELRPMKISG